MKRLAVTTLVLVLMLGLTPTAVAGDGWRTWKVTYNSALSLHECACPGAYKMGEQLRIAYKGKTLKVKVVDVGPYFDISDEGMNKLASTSKGVIKAKVKRV